VNPSYDILGIAKEGTLFPDEFVKSLQGMATFLPPEIQSLFASAFLIFSPFS
jgi:hypothetical protein